MTYITLTVHKHDNHTFLSSTVIHLALFAYFQNVQTFFCYFIISDSFYQLGGNLIVFILK